MPLQIERRRQRRRIIIWRNLDLSVLLEGGTGPALDAGPASRPVALAHCPPFYRGLYAFGVTEMAGLLLRVKR